jgi:four helix bundle protein
MDKAIKQESRTLTAQIVALYRRLSTQKKETVLSAELLRAGGGVGAELARAECAMNRGDQLQKVYAALQNCSEAKYWLEVLNDGEFLTEFEFTGALKALDTMGKDLIAMVKTMRAKG